VAAVGETHLVAIVPTGCLSSASSLRARARRRILMVSPTVCPVALNARLIVRTDKPCARATALGLKCSSRRFCSMNRSTASRSAGPPPGHHHHHPPQLSLPLESCDGPAVWPHDRKACLDESPSGRPDLRCEFVGQ